MDILMPIIIFYFIYSVVMAIIKNISRTKTLKMLIDNNLINNSDNNINLDFLSAHEKSSNKRNILPIALGIMGFSLGLLCATYLIMMWTGGRMESMSAQVSYETREMLKIGLPLFFASIGVLIAYFIERAGQK